ncbi:diacylglycerol/lipid kinase family protein [Pelagibacterium xiamenense]|uniref:diacylglycerol/lipid kinase family protein n=1 Tax=Pelagibacterium xiamenense TaxID=2901140 RepID=UPI001E59BFD4|nr:diacylglycerol kinase family protein [Pelagibacterium xiamenense]MCD7059685.1 diacylglycerol kinase [Pelagibacterium xiamenense]
MASGRYHVLLNRNSGTVQALGITPEMLAERFEQHGFDAIVDGDTETPVAERIERAVASDAQVIVAAGGDGTVTSTAARIMGTGKTLAVLPLGTFNLLARDLGVPLDLDAWIEALPHMVSKDIDVAEVNGTIFLHKAVIGVMPDIAAAREKIRGAGRLAGLSYLRYVFRRVARSRRLALEVVTDTGEKRIERVHAIGVASNAYDEEFGHFMSRQHLDSGILTLYKVDRMSPLAFVRLAAGMIAGHWRDDPSLRIQSAHAVTIRSRKPRLQVMIDGEIESLETPLHFTIKHKALPILALPAQAEAPAENPTVAAAP